MRLPLRATSVHCRARSAERRTRHVTVFSRGAAPDGSQGWSEQRERNPWETSEENAEAPEGRRKPHTRRFPAPLRGFILPVVRYQGLRLAFGRRSTPGY